MRYERQLFFKYIGKEGQEKIRTSTVTLVGVGALGSVSAELLARAGIGKLILIDPDTVEIHNLQRQSLFNEKDVGKLKVEVAKEKLNLINSEVEVIAHSVALNEKNLDLLENIIVDGTDNMETRTLIDSHCSKNKIPWVYGGIASSVGMIYFVKPGKISFNDIFGNIIPGITCESEGVLNTIAYTVASFQVTQVLKYIVGEDTEEDLIRFNIWNGEFERIKVKKMSRKKILGNLIIEKCKTKATWKVRDKKQKRIDFEKVKQKMDKIDIDTPNAIIGEIDGEEVIINHLEIMFKKCEDKEKMMKIAKRLF
jgi:molybdopterin-synthase adenylyltransferase